MRYRHTVLYKGKTCTIDIQYFIKVKHAIDIQYFIKVKRAIDIQYFIKVRHAL